MRQFFLDTEFIERGREHPIQLISIGIVDDSGRSFYAISSEFDPSTASDWVMENVIRCLEPGSQVQRQSISEIAEGVMKFVRGAYPFEFWGYYSDYDWVVFCQLFGTMMDLPATFPKYCRDLRQWLNDRGHTEVSQPDSPHNALGDAEWIRDTWRTYAEHNT